MKAILAAEPISGGDQTKHTKHRTKPPGEVQGMGIWCSEGRIREGLLREVSSELGHKGAGKHRPGGEGIHLWVEWPRR